MITGKVSSQLPLLMAALKKEFPHLSMDSITRRQVRQYLRKLLDTEDQDIIGRPLESSQPSSLPLAGMVKVKECLNGMPEEG